MITSNHLPFEATRVVIKGHAAARFAEATETKVHIHATSTEGPQVLDPLADADMDLLDEILDEDPSLVTSAEAFTASQILWSILRTRFDQPTTERILRFVENPTNETASAAVEYAEV